MRCATKEAEGAVLIQIGLGIQEQIRPTYSCSYIPEERPRHGVPVTEAIWLPQRSFQSVFLVCFCFSPASRRVSIVN